MNLQWAGLVLGGVTFATIGLGHVLVRWVHARWGTRPGVPLFLLGLGVLYAALITPNDLLSGVLGITAITLLWDGFEVYRQEQRVRKGHIPPPRRR